MSNKIVQHICNFLVDNSRRKKREIKKPFTCGCISDTIQVSWNNGLISIINLVLPYVLKTFKTLKHLFEQGLV